MNERIKQLAIECANLMEWNPPHDPDAYTFYSDNLETFAKAIILECSKYLKETDYDDIDSPNQALELAADDLLDYFEIK